MTKNETKALAKILFEGQTGWHILTHELITGVTDEFPKVKEVYSKMIDEYDELNK